MFSVGASFASARLRAINISPKPIDPRKAADLVQASRATIQLVACDKLHRGVLIVELAMRANLKSQPLRSRYCVHAQFGRTGVGMPCRAQIAFQMLDIRAVPRAHQGFGVGRDKQARVVWPATRCIFQCGATWTHCVRVHDPFLGGQRSLGWMEGHTASSIRLCARAFGWILSGCIRLGSTPTPQMKHGTSVACCARAISR